MPSKKSIQIEIPVRIWLKIFQSVIEPIALYGSEVWGPLLNHEFDKWDKTPTETLQKQTNTTNSSQPQDTDTPIHRITKTQKDNYLTYWIETTEK